MNKTLPSVHKSFLVTIITFIYQKGIRILIFTINSKMVFKPIHASTTIQYYFENFRYLFTQALDNFI